MRACLLMWGRSHFLCTFSLRIHCNEPSITECRIEIGVPWSVFTKSSTAPRIFRRSLACEPLLYCQDADPFSSSAIYISIILPLVGRRQSARSSDFPIAQNFVLASPSAPLWTETKLFTKKSSALSNPTGNTELLITNERDSVSSLLCNTEAVKPITGLLELSQVCSASLVVYGRTAFASHDELWEVFPGISKPSSLRESDQWEHFWEAWHEVSSFIIAIPSRDLRPRLVWLLYSA